MVSLFQVIIRLRRAIDFKKTGAGIVCLPPGGWKNYQEENFYRNDVLAVIIRNHLS